MLVDDNQLTNTLNERTLIETSMVREVVVKNSVDDALIYLRSRKRDDQALPDIIFLDIIMPRSNGWDFLQLYKEEFGQPRPNSVVMLTSSADVNHLMECAIHPEIQDFVIKPLTDVETKRILTQYCNFSRFQKRI